MTIWYSAGICIKAFKIKSGAGPTALLPDKAAEFEATTRKSLDAIRSTPMGSQMLVDIGASGHVVTIYRAWDIQTGNYQGGEDTIASMVVPFDTQHDDGRLELSVVLDRACQDMSGRSKLKKMLGIGKAKPRFLNRDALGRLVNLSPRDLQAMESGRKAIDSTVEARLRALLYDFLTPGPGSNCHVCFNHERLNLSQDHELHLPSYKNWKNRPVPVALAHELIHAWRVVVGRVLYRYGWEEEAMTVGLPPFSSMKYTENRFRIEFDNTGLAIRPDYQHRQAAENFIDSHQAAIDPTTRAWQGKASALEAKSPLRNDLSAAMGKRRAAMGFADEDGFDG